MMLLKEKYTKYIFLIAIILIQLSGCYSDDTEVKISCVQCGGANDECKSDLTVNLKECPDETYKKCFTQIDTSGKIVRGCKKPEEIDNCKAENNCVITEEGKNNQLICKKCDGTDEKCSQTDMKLNDLKYNQICKEGVKKCLMKVDSKLVVRGCDDDNTQCVNENTCKTCNEINCNTGIFPTKRINCYQCSDSSCLDVTSNGVSKPCPNYVEDDKCYTLGKSETEMIRGCQSDTKDNQCSSASKDCAFCSTDNCNNLKYKYDQKLKCHQCSSSDPTDDCFKQQTGSELKNCEKQIAYNDKEYCYTRLDNDGSIQRGCLHDNDKVTLDNCGDGDSKDCNKCNTANGCNNKEMTYEFTCIVCRSDLDERCWNDADKLEGQTCRTSVSSPKEGCFHGIWNGNAIRGCFVDASIQNQEVCKDKENPQCNVCYKKNCNTLKSSASRKSGIQFALVLIVLTTLWNFK